MNCDEAREWFPALLAGELALTEGVLVETHVGQCAACHQALEEFQESRDPRRAARLHAPPEAAGKGSPPALPPDVSLPPHHRLLPVTVFRLSAIAVALMLVTALGIHLVSRSAEPEAEGPRAAAPVTLEAEAPAEAPTPAPPAAPPIERKAPPVASAGAKPKEPAAAPHALPARPERPTVVAKTGSAKADQPAAAAPARSQPATNGRSKPSEEKAAPRPSAAPAPDRGLAAEPPSPSTDPTVDVVMQLAARNRSTAIRDLRAVLARLGGTAQGRNQGGTILVIVPHSRYSDFTHSLTRIGTWQLEAERSSLPDPVRVTVRMVR